MIREHFHFLAVLQSFGTGCLGYLLVFELYNLFLNFDGYVTLFDFYKHLISLHS